MPKPGGYYDKAGKKIGFMKWARLLQDKDYQIVAQDNVDKYFISTVWMGLDHSLGYSHPLIFETMVYGQADDEKKSIDRYSTLEEAEYGHKRFVERYNNIKE